MSTVRLTCPCGHSWEQAPVQPLPANMRTICPLCSAKEGSGSSSSTIIQSSVQEAQSAAVSVTPMPGQGIAGFELLEELNRGGMGVVYKARQTALNRVVAVKAIAPAKISDPRALTLFDREVKAAASLNHPNIVMVYHTELDGPFPYLAMEYVPGIDLFRLVRDRGPLVVADAVYYVRQAAEGLQHAHEIGLVHRDVKPSNLMVTPIPEGKNGGRRAKLKILDMGLARVVVPGNANAEERLRPGVFLGTPDYVAPEQVIDSSQADARSDVYGLGATLYFVLTGEVPFPGKTLEEKVRLARTSRTPSAMAKRPDVPLALDAIIKRMLARDPAQRYQSAAEVIVALTAVLRELDRTARGTDPRSTGKTPMSENLFEIERSALTRLNEAVTARTTAEAELLATFTAAVEKAEREGGRAKKSNATARSGEFERVDDSHAQAIAKINRNYDTEQLTIDRALDERRKVMNEKYKAAEQRGRTEYADRLWHVDSMLEAGEKAAKEQLESLQRKAAAGKERVETLRADAEDALAQGGVTREEIAFIGEPVSATDEDPITHMNKAIATAEETLTRLAGLRSPAWAGFPGLVGLVLISAAFGAISFAALDATIAAGITAGVGLLMGVGLWLFVRRLARQSALRLGKQLDQNLAEADTAVQGLNDFATKEYAEERVRVSERHARKRTETDEHYLPMFEAKKSQYEAEILRAENEHETQTDRITRERETELQEQEQVFQGYRIKTEARLEAELKYVEESVNEKTAAATYTRDKAWSAMKAAWDDATTSVADAFRTLRHEGDELFPPWSAVASTEHALADRVPAGIRCGDWLADMQAIDGGVPADPQLAPPAELTGSVPAFLPFPDRCSVLLRARDEGRAAAVVTLQAMMLRFLTGLPPGKVRFTIIDPVGLGENFAAFMHLADHDEKLVTSQIWTEPVQIEQRLTDLTDHIASVIQKYLRNQYKTIEDYNRAAGEVAEPYRVLVVANFPTNFTPEAAKRLISIAQSGPSCGVCTLVAADTRSTMPREFNISDLEAASFTLAWKDGHFTPKDPTLATFPLVLDQPPDTTTVAEMVQRVGKASKDAKRVEVPFEYIAPKPGDEWKGDASKGFEVPVGRAGATRRQSFTLGRGTAQHALVAGKTGSGKSTLLHALITNLALIYSPDEAELYLIDFKEGVEFQWYATYRLPHARVVAIQSEREFGLSVLQRLDGILRERGEKFRDAGVNDLAGYRAAHPDQKTPRILLVVDEFQAFFTEDDKLAQEAALLLDRIVRQGRAFGLHVLLGSQTLGGAYSLARSTIDQMAVRVALQCSDADAQLILSKDNNAARLLSRPGEAIYNDQNGLTEGNDPFQVVWLAEEKREELLSDLRDRAGDRWPPPLVFSGNSAADPESNQALSRFVTAPTVAKSPTAWLGDPVAIKDPTAAVFRTVGGSNLLMIGQNEPAARGLFAAAAVALAAQLPAGIEQQITILDGTPDDAEDAEYLAKLAPRVPGVVAPARSDLPAALAELAGEVDRRMKGESADRSLRFLLVFGLQRFRELRKSDDDFGFGRRGAEREPTPVERLHAILRDGPPVGVHIFAWCDSLTNLNRAFERPQLREFGMRVLFQMSATDSSTLMDTPAASRLGRNRALFLHEDQERPEKFRPYGLPTPEWLDRVCATLRGRVGLNPEAAGV